MIHDQVTFRFEINHSINDILHYLFFHCGQIYDLEFLWFSFASAILYPIAGPFICSRMLINKVRFLVEFIC